jgi:hypothetical protein
VQCSAVQCSAVQCSAVQCSAVQCSAVQCSAVQCSAVWCSAVQCSAVQCSAVQCGSWTVPYLNTHSPSNISLVIRKPQNICLKSISPKYSALGCPGGPAPPSPPGRAAVPIHSQRSGEEASGGPAGGSDQPRSRGSQRRQAGVSVFHISLFCSSGDNCVHEHVVTEERNMLSTELKTQKLTETS